MVFLSLYFSVPLLLATKNIYLCTITFVAVPLFFSTIQIILNNLLFNKRFLNVSTKRKTPLSIWSKFVTIHQRKIIRYIQFFTLVRTKKLSNLKIVLFFLVCKNLHSESALEKIWHSSVYRYIEHWAKRYSKR